MASHVEVKAATMMRTYQIKKASLVINNEPCAFPKGCEDLLPAILPEGFELVVYGANDFYQVYRGGARSPWAS